VPETLETTALGAAYLAGLATGFWEDREELKNRWRLRRRYEPQMGEEERERLYGRWQEALARSKDWAQVLSSRRLPENLELRGKHEESH
jgi:glycerol kinase